MGQHIVRVHVFGTFEPDFTEVGQWTRIEGEAHIRPAAFMIHRQDRLVLSGESIALFHHMPGQGLFG